MFVGVAAAAVGAAVYVGWKPSPVPPQPYVAPSADELPPSPEKGKAWSVRPEGNGPPRLAKKGIASVSYGTIPSVVTKAAVVAGTKNALAVERRPYPTDGTAGEWKFYSWNDYRDNARRFAKALLSMGHQPFESVAICGFNAPEWHFAHVGANFAAGMSAGTYTTNSPAACAFVANDSSAIVAVVDTMANANKYLAVRAELPKIKHIIVYLDAVPDDKRLGGFVLSFDEFLAKGNSVSDSTLDARTNLVLPQHCASLIYTSGTTGNPKGVMASHDGLLFSSAAGIASMALPDMDHYCVSYLPMSHIAAQMLDLAVPALNTSMSTNHASCVYFARPDVLKGTLLLTLKAVRPTNFFGVPRVWEKIVEGMKAKAKADPPKGAKLKLIQWAKSVGLANSRARQAHGDGDLCRGTHLAESLVFAKVRAALGFDRCIGYYSGAAPIQRETLEFLSSLGIDICEVYGMSETCGVGSSSRCLRFQFGSCGARTLMTEMKIDHVDGRDKENEGEVCFRGRHVMMGYLNNAEKTREAIDDEGWMHSGDIGRFDAQQMLYITGRIKELIIGAGGENVAPVPIEEELKRLLPAVSNAVLIGDKRKYMVVMFTPRLEPDFVTGGFKDNLIGDSSSVDPEAKTAAQAARSVKWKQYLEAGVKAYNAGPKCVSNAQKVQKCVLLTVDLSIPGGELTPTMKLKRSVVSEKYSADIEALYAGDESSPM